MEKKHHYKEEKTFVMIKPDGVQRSLVGDIVHRFENVGLKLVAIKMLLPTQDEVEKHYTVNPEWKRNVGEKSIEGYRKNGVTPPSEDPEEVGNIVLGYLSDYLASGPVVAMVWQGGHAVHLVRKLIGSTEPLSSDVGTIRGDYVMDSYEMADGDGRAVRNLIHASGSYEEARAEIAHWFSENEIIRYHIINEKILYDVAIDGVLE
ncbi:MAG: nucleoside-diphosphate kinase [Candidatus Spechtbacteria bacterium SB0662_bin_43]|uniref:nucleoside-diphosphate kinase n=1 Tax=Candidatus Spechtbacteria bacterium SB0662_bin_43 TaxID=2604897 RepID=A0A845DIN2_9BACT|nr:nucleoside-diphosphate kinase [Candidatus Spechtbacteria bacterium SB0662_bin_43]